MSFEGQNLQEMGKWTKNEDSEKSTPQWRVGLPPPGCNIHVYNHNIQRSFSLEPLGQSKSIFIGNIYMKGESMCL